MSKSKFLGSSGLLAILLTTSFSGFDAGLSAQTKPKQNSGLGEGKYQCYRDRETGVPTTYFVDREQNTGIAIVIWKSNYFKDWTPTARCKEVSNRFQNAHILTGGLHITNSTLNSAPVICATSNQSSRSKGCPKLLFTLENFEEANAILLALERTLESGASGAITRGVPPSEGGKFFVNMNTLLQQGKKVRLGAPL